MVELMIDPELQDEKGRMKKGHPFIGNRNGIKNGAKKTISGKIKDALSIAEDIMPQLYLDMIRDAQDPNASIRDRQMCREYLSDRIYGRPNQPLSGNVNLNVWAELVKSATLTVIVGERG